LGISCKKTQLLRVAQAQRVVETLKLGDIETRKGLNQEMGLGRPRDTHWASHSETVMHLIYLYPSTQKVLIKAGNDHSQGVECSQAQTMLIIF